MLDVTGMLRPERAALLELLRGLSPSAWGVPTECPAYSVQGVATHVLGDDLSLLSRQRDAATNGLVQLAFEPAMAGVDFRTLLDTFNDRWVTAASFFSPAVLVALLDAAGEWTAAFYESVDLSAPCEPVGFFAMVGPEGMSPYWQAIAREFMERWVHHSQIRRALGMGSLADERFVGAGVSVVAAAAGVEGRRDDADGSWWIGPLRVGDAQQTADVLTRRHTADEVRALVSGPAESVELAAASFGRT